MLRKNYKLISLSIIFSFLLYLSFMPWEYTDFWQHISMMLILLIFPVIIASKYKMNKVKEFSISLLFFLAGLLFLYRGFYFNNQFYILDYIFYRNVQSVIETGNKIIHGTPLSLWWVESVIIYCILNITGLIFASFVQKNKGS